jgi:hypothetical protein
MMTCAFFSHLQFFNADDAESEGFRYKFDSALRVFFRVNAKTFVDVWQ